jgi:ABC-type transport system substrate-binding protein
MVNYRSIFLGIVLCFTLVISGLSTYANSMSDFPELKYAVAPFFNRDVIAQVIQSDLEKIGITVTLDMPSYTEAWTDWKNNEYHMIFGAMLSFVADTSSLLHTVCSSETNHYGHWSYGIERDPDIIALFQQARGNLNRPEREQLYQEIFKLMNKQVPFFPLVYPEMFLPHTQGLVGLYHHPLTYVLNRYANVSMSGLTHLIVSNVLPVTTLDPAAGAPGECSEDWHVQRQIYESLYDYAADSLNLLPTLATNYSVGGSPNGTEWTFSLRQGVTFHDGTPFNASAVKFSLERIMNWDNETSDYFRYGWVPSIISLRCQESPLISLNTSVIILNDNLVKFTLSEPYAPFLHDIPYYLPIVSPTYVMTHNSTDDPERLLLHPVGTGPYKFTSQVQGQTVKLEKFEDHWDSPPKTPFLIIKIIADPVTTLNELIAGTIHVMNSLSVQHAEIATIEALPNIEVKPMLLAGPEVTWINSRREPFNNSEEVEDPDGGTITHGALVRRALLYAINRTRMVEEIFQGRAQVAIFNPSEPDWLGYNSSVQPYPYDREKAIGILRSLGYDVSAAERTGSIPLITLITTLGAIFCLVVLEKKDRR